MDSNMKVVMDRVPRYTPDRVVMFEGMIVHRRVIGVMIYPPGKHPAGTPLVSHVTAVELKTEGKSCWYGCERAYINSQLRAVVVGFPANFEEMAKWEEVPKELW